jgi:hypothetical protein
VLVSWVESKVTLGYARTAYVEFRVMR